MKKPSQSAQIVLVVVGLVAAAAGAYMFLIGPKRTSADQVAQQVQATQTQIDTLRARAAATPQVQPSVAVNAAELFRLVKAMPDGTDMAGVLLELNRLATDTGIVFDSITPGQPVARDGYSTLPIQLTFMGNFYELSDFLFRVRSLVAVHDGDLTARGRLYNVESISFAEAEDSFPQLTATLTVDAYVFGGGGAAAATTPAAPAAPTTPTAPAAASS
jgi:type IV pilus assembly protein PilO